METNALIVIEPANPAELFVPEVIAELVTKVVAITDKHVSDVTTDAGRRATKSLARQVASAKMTVDGIGKRYVADLKALPKEVDALREKFRDTMDSIRDEVRRPVTEWEEAEKQKALIAALEVQKDADEIEAYVEEDLRERERKVAEQQAEMDRKESERLAKEEADRRAAEQTEREERIAREAAEKAERKAKEEADRKEAKRLADEAQAQAEAEKKAANKRHRAMIEREILESLDHRGIQNGDEVLAALKSGLIQHVTINY